MIMDKRGILIGLCLALTLAVFSFLACEAPDGLERVAQDKNFIGRAATLIKAPLRDYLFPGISNGKIAASLAGALGVITVFLLTTGLLKILRRR